MFNMKYSAFFLISFCLLNLGCSSRVPLLKDYDTGILRSAPLVERYGRIQGRQLKAYSHYLSTRLIQSIPDQELPGDTSSDQFEITVLNSTTPLAYSPGGGLILVSKGLVWALQSEAELAFVIGHEMAHQYLNHTTFDEHEYEKNVYSQRQQALEYEADEFALGMMALAGYDPRAAVSGLINAYRRAGASKHSSTHPQLEQRIDAISELIKEAKWTPPGTLNRRDFREFRFRLKDLSAHDGISG